MKTKLFLSLVVVSLVSGCAYDHEIGGGYHLYTSAEALAPSATIVENKETGFVQVIPGQSVVGQLIGPASNVGSAALLAKGLKDSRSSNNINSQSTSTQTQGQGQLQGQLQTQSNSLKNSVGVDVDVDVKSAAPSYHH